MGSYGGHTITDEIHRVQQADILLDLFGQGATGLCCCPCGEVGVRALVIPKLAVLSTCSGSIHLVAVKGRDTLEGLCTHDIVEILIQIEAGDILTDFLSAAPSHGRHASGHPCGSCAPDAPVDRRLNSSLAAEREAERVGDVCPRILGLLSTADDDLLDIVEVVIGIERCTISLLQPERVDISRELCC